MAGRLSVGEAMRARWRATGLPSRDRRRAAATASAEVSRLGAVQAQEFDVTLWSLGRRTGESRPQVLAAFEAGDIVRTHALRQTWHFVHHDDLTWVQAATAHRVQQRNATLYRQEGLDPATLARAGTVIEAALRDGPLPRRVLREHLAAAGISATAFRLGLVMMWAELECLVASGPQAGKQQTHQLWRQRTLPDPDEAVVRLAERFFASHGPATADDLVAWCSLTKGQARAAMADLPLEQAEVDGEPHWWLGPLDVAAWDTPRVELLNSYDEYVAGLSAAHKRRLDRAGLYSGPLSEMIAMLMVDGQLAGHWRRRSVRGEQVIEVQLLRDLTGGELQALQDNADAYGRFVGQTASTQVVFN